MNNALSLTGVSSDYRLSITPERQQQKTEALALSATVKSVESPQQQQDAIAAAAICKRLVNEMEDSRVEIKVIPWKICGEIDTEAKAYKKELLVEIDRTEKLAGAWQAEQNRKAAALKVEEERRQQEQRDAEQVERDKAAAAIKRLEDEAYAARQADLKRIADAKTENERQQAERAADIAAEERAVEIHNVQLACLEADQQRIDAERDRAGVILAIPTPKAIGAIVRVVMDYELKDIRALYAARPDLVELTPRRALILAAISIPNQPAIPGLYVFESTKVQAKAS